jgi:protein involved in polysaccharide export with SLBB domain
MINMIRTSLVVLIVSALGLSQTGCSSTKARPASEAPPVGNPNPVIGLGDELEVKFYYSPELNLQQKVRSDGMISMQLVGDVQAAGLTPGQLDATLQELYSKHLKYPEIAVVVRGTYARRILVGGEVARPGVVDMPAQMSAFEAILLSGGFNLTTANTGQVIVMRDDGTGKRTGYALNMKDTLKGAASEPFMLQPTDIVFVPRTAVVDVNQFVQQYVNNNVPNIGFQMTQQTPYGSYGVDLSGR